jgi:hypothetical protein
MATLLNPPNPRPIEQQLSRTSHDRGLRPRTWVVALVLTVLAGMWVRQAEIVVIACQITEAVPAIPGLTGLVLLIALNPLLRRLGLRPFSRAELLAIFLFVTIACSMMGVGVMRFLLALMTAPFYFPGLKAAGAALPSWVAPHDKEVIRRLYESDLHSRVPWEAWWIPMAVWTGFFLVLWLTMHCIALLYYRTWAEDERLAFPAVMLPLEMTAPPGERGSLTNLFRSKAMWAGFSLAAIYNLVNILHAYHPSFPDFGKNLDAGASIQNLPWVALKPLTMEFRPELIGLGYIVATDVSLTVWAGYLLLRLGAVLATMYGHPPGPMPYPQEQGMGAYIVLGALFAYSAVRRIATALRGRRSRLGGRATATTTEQWAALGVIVGAAAVIGFCWLVGMALWVAALYVGIILCVCVVYARIRGEVGAPLLWLFPYYMPKQVMLYTLGSTPFALASATTLPAFALFTFLARGYFPAMIGYQIEGLELGRRGGISRRQITAIIVVALLVGFGMGWYFHLAPYYHHGAQYLRGGIWGSGMAVQEYTWAAGYLKTPKLADPLRTWATAGGGITAFVLLFLRQRFVGFPFHPLGYAMTCSYGSLIWFPFLLVWVLKGLVLRYGGMRLYRATVPAFLGFALGHYFVAGALWGLIGAFSGDAVRGYGVWFG